MAQFASAPPVAQLGQEGVIPTRAAAPRPEQSIALALEARLAQHVPTLGTTPRTPWCGPGGRLPGAVTMWQFVASYVEVCLRIILRLRRNPAGPSSPALVGSAPLVRRDDSCSHRDRTAAAILGQADHGQLHLGGRWCSRQLPALMLERIEKQRHQAPPRVWGI
jgi:hypothetical protein